MRERDNKMATETDDIRGARRERDMILTTYEYIHVLDETKGDVSLYVGPNKTSLATTDRPMILDTHTGRFKACDLATGTQAFITAKEGEYIVLENPAEGDKYPTGSGKLTTPQLRTGKKINIPGPASFALWPGQSAKVVPGHSLRSNEYLLVRVYDEEAAKANWKNSVIKTQTTDEGAGAGMKVPTVRDTDIPSADQMSMGKLFVIRGTQVSFYVPATGVEVVPEVVSNEERFVREAVSLEVLEYALLIDQDGTKRYEYGPKVVFPRPTERFVEAPIKSNPERAKAKKFRFQELTASNGIHIRVIADYVDEKTGIEHHAGEELFITGETTSIYAPRAEHAIVKNGDADLHFAVVIPPGDTKYVLDKAEGTVSLVRGPKIFLPDPRKHVIVQRALSLTMCELMYPGNETVRAVNAARLGSDDQDIYAASASSAVLDNAATGSYGNNYEATSAIATADTSRRVMIRGASKSLPGDSFDRKGKYTAPRSVVLNTKLDGAVSSDVWTGYAMLLISKSGTRRVVQGPQTAVLEYDELPQVMTLSRGKPKNTDDPLKTVFLLTRANMVSDIVEVETRDFCKLNVKLAYRVNFEGDDPERWFGIDNYVKFLCDHMRSRIRAAVQRLGIEEFYGNHTPILRDVILGTAPDGSTVRPGTAFAENGMRIYDAEILGVELKDTAVANLLVASQREVIQNALSLAAERRKFEYAQELEDIKRKNVLAQAETQRMAAQTSAETQRQAAMQAAETRHVITSLESVAAQDKLTLDLITLEAAAKVNADQVANELAVETAKAEVAAVQAKVQASADEARHANAAKNQALRLAELDANTKAMVDKTAAVTPDLIAAMTAFGDKALIGELSKSMAPLGILGGKSVVDVTRNLLAGTPLAKYLDGTDAAMLDPSPGTGVPEDAVNAQTGRRGRGR